MCSARNFMKVNLTQKKVDTLEASEKRFKVYDARLSGFFVLVRPSGKKSYWCYLRVNGKATDYLLGGCEELTLKKAKEMGAAALVKARSGVSAIEERQVAKSGTLLGFLDSRYRDFLVNNHKTAQTTLWILEVAFKEFLNMQLADITVNRVESWRLKNQKTLSFSTLNRRTAALKSALSTARKWGLIDANPLSDLSQKKVVLTPVVFLNDSEVEILKRVLRKRDAKMIAARKQYNSWRRERKLPLLPHYEDLEVSFADHLTPLTTLIIETGLRFSEAISLTWSDVDFLDHAITVRSSKTSNYRIIPMHSDVYISLKDLKRLNYAYTGASNQRVFVTTSGRPLESVKTSWNGVRKQLDFVCDWRMLRRTFGSRLVKKGVPVYTVSKLLGHSSVKTTELWYVGLDLKTKRAAINTIDNF